MMILIALTFLISFVSSYEYYEYDYDYDYEYKVGGYGNYEYGGKYGDGYEYGGKYGDGYEYGSHGVGEYEYYDYEYGGDTKAGNQMCQVCSICQPGYEVNDEGICEKLSKKRNPGETCSSDSSCKSLTCRGQKCCEMSDGNGFIQKCSNKGKIDSCVEGYVFWEEIDHCTKKLPVGAKCSSSDLCQHSCESGYCCGGDMPNCNKCQKNSGRCMACDEGFILKNGECVEKLKKGKTCASSNECSSGICRKKCCAASGEYDGCLECNSNGRCAKCKKGYISIAGSCIKPKAFGQQCSDDAECKSEACVNDFCCKASVSDDCEKCNKQGACMACAGDLVPHNGVTCVEPDYKRCLSTCAKLKGASKCEANTKNDCDCQFKKISRKKGICIPSL